MTYWDGNRWLPDGPEGPARARGGVRRRLLGASTEAALITLLMFGLIAGTTLAAKGGNGGGGGPHRSVSTCQIDGDLVSAGGLPTNEVINFLITDSSGTWGWVLGLTDGDYWATTVPERTGPATYQFVSRTWGPSGAKYNVYASCSATI